MSLTNQELLRLYQELEQRVAARTAELERSQAELRKSEAHLLAAQRIALLGSWEFEISTGAITWSAEVYRIFGRDAAQGPPSLAELLALYLPEDRLRHQQVLEEAIREVQPYVLELRLRRPSGEVRHIQARSEPVVDEAGQLIGIVGTVLDLTERIQAEEQRRNLTDRLALAVRSAAIGIWEWDVITDTLTWDQRMFEIYGLNPDDYPSAYAAWQQGLHPDDRETGHQAIQRALRGEQEFDTEFRVVHPDGTVRDIKAYGLVQRDPYGQPLRMIGVNFDTGLPAPDSRWCPAHGPAD